MRLHVLVDSRPALSSLIWKSKSSVAVFGSAPEVNSADQVPLNDTSSSNCGFPARF